MWQMVFAYVSIKGWIVDPYVEVFFDGSHEVLVFPPHNAKIIYSNRMTRGVVVVIYMGKSLLMFLEPLSKCSC